MFIDRSESTGFEAPTFFNPKPLSECREVTINNDQVWRYKWSGDQVNIFSPDGQQFEAPTWELLEITEGEYKEWAADGDGGLIVTAKDVSDYIKVRILRKTMSRRLAGLYS